MGQKIRQARKAHKLSQEDLAKMAGCNQADVTRLERGEVTHSKYLAAILKALQLDEDTRATIPVVGYVGAGSEVFAMDDHTKGDGIEEIEAPYGMLNGIAVIVRGNSMEPKYSDGEVLFIEKTVYAVDSLIGEPVYVQTADGRSYVKKLHYGASAGTFTLVSFNAPPIENVAIERVYPIAYTKPRYRTLK
jgi:phage repressor protein C with HTH and peptisase S24 domain